MSRGLFLAVFVLLLYPGISALASQLPADGSADSSTPSADAGIQGSVPEVKPEPQAGSVPAAELATSSAAGSAEPRPTPTPAPSSAMPITEESPAEPRIVIPVPTEILPASPETVSPWVWLVGLLALAAGGIYGAYTFMKASQTKGPQSANTCDAIQDSLNKKQYDLSLAEHEFSFNEEALRLLEEKAKDKAESEKNKIIKKIEGTAKDTLLGKKGE